MQRCHEVATLIVSCLAEGLGLPQDHFTKVLPGHLPAAIWSPFPHPFQTHSAYFLSVRTAFLITRCICVAMTAGCASAHIDRMHVERMPNAIEHQSKRLVGCVRCIIQFMRSSLHTPQLAKQSLTQCRDV